MNILEKIEELKNLVQGNKIPATGRSMINVENFIEQIDEIKSLIPSEVSASEGIIRQKEAIIKQAEDEAERIRGYADEEAVKINDNASNKAESLIQNAKDEAYKMITNTEIVTASKNAAQEIEDKANKEAESIIEQGKNEGLRPQIYTHPLGTFGHSAGTTLGMWDSQGGVPFTGDFPMNYNTVYAIELNTKVFIEEWNKDIRVMLEEAGVFEKTGDRRIGADNYAREVLFSLEEKIADTLGQVRGGIDILDVRKETSVAD